MCAVMKWVGWAVRSGRSLRSEGDMGVCGGRESRVGGRGGERRVWGVGEEGRDVVFVVIGDADLIMDVGGASLSRSSVSSGVIIWAVELKLRARKGRRKVGGRRERVSSALGRIVFSMLMVWVMCIFTLWSILLRVLLSFLIHVDSIRLSHPTFYINLHFGV